MKGYYPDQILPQHESLYPILGHCEKVVVYWFFPNSRNLRVWGISFHVVVVFGLGKNLLLKSVLGRCVVHTQYLGQLMLIPSFSCLYPHEWPNYSNYWVAWNCWRILLPCGFLTKLFLRFSIHSSYIFGHFFGLQNNTPANA